MKHKREFEYGKVIDYDGHDGTIRGLDGIDYILKKSDIAEKEKIQVEDYVIFDKEIIHNIDIKDIPIARFVKKIKK